MASVQKLYNEHITRATNLETILFPTQCYSLIVPSLCIVICVDSANVHKNFSLTLEKLTVQDGSRQALLY